MSPGDENLLRNVTREMLAELLPELLEEALTGPREANGNGNGHSRWHTTTPPGGGTSIEQDIPHDPTAGPVPQVPAPPVAAVHRPPGWHAPAPGEKNVPGTFLSPADAPPPTAPAPDGDVEQVTIRSDADLDAFVRQLARRLENPKDRMEILSGRLRFALAGGGASQAPGAGPALRIDRGAVTERHVREAAEKGARLVLAPRAVLTPMARDRARTLGVEIEKERRC